MKLIKIVLLLFLCLFLLFWYRVYNSTDWISEDVKSYERLKESIFVAFISFIPLLLMTPISFPLAILGVDTQSAYPDGI